MKKILVLAIALILPFLIIRAYSDIGKTQGTEASYTVIVSPIGSRNVLGQWQGEIAPFMEKLEQERNLGEVLPLCEEAYSGYVYGQPVITAVSGLGKVKSAVCVNQILESYKDRVKEVILSGTAGISPMEGARIGDVCINSIAGDFDMQYFASEQPGQDGPNPIFWSFSENNHIDEKLLNSGLAEEIFEASKNITVNNSPDEVVRINRLYQKDIRQPRIWGPDECLEISGDLFWHDLSAETAAKEIAGKIMPDYKVLVTSMEAISVGNVVNWWNEAFKTKIDFAYVRGASNFDQAPRADDGLPTITAKDSLQNGMTRSTVEYAEYNAAGAILRMLEKRSVLK